ncbi:hypothetical protein BC567DRAFT_217529 [Phyllosticta citribraziliensis]
MSNRVQFWPPIRQCSRPTRYPSPAWQAQPAYRRLRATRRPLSWPASRIPAEGVGRDVHQPWAPSSPVHL